MDPISFLDKGIHVIAGCYVFDLSVLALNKKDGQVRKVKSPRY